MTRDALLLNLHTLLERDPGTLQGPELLESIGWDSLSVISFIALVDEEMGFTVNPSALAKCKTLDDVMATVADLSLIHI